MERDKWTRSRQRHRGLGFVERDGGHGIDSDTRDSGLWREMMDSLQTETQGTRVCGDR